MTTPRARTRSARHGGPNAAILLGIAVLAAACSFLEPGIPVATAADAAERRVFSSGVQADTLDYDWREIFPVAVARLERDRWEIQHADTARRRVITRWKTMDHMLARLALGDVLARCVVELSPLPGGRTIVRMRGGLASTEDLDSKPVFGTAQAAYRKAARKYLNGVRVALDRANATAGMSTGDDEAPPVR